MLWTAGSLLLVYTGRYLKLVSMWGMRLHILLGILVPAFTIGFSVNIAAEERSDINGAVRAFHGGAAIISILANLILIVNGFVLRCQLRRSVMPSWLGLMRWLHKVRLSLIQK